MIRSSGLFVRSCRQWLLGTQHFGGIRDEGKGGADFDGTRCKVVRSAGDESGRKTHKAYAGIYAIYRLFKTYKMTF